MTSDSSSFKKEDTPLPEALTLSSTAHPQAKDQTNTENKKEQLPDLVTLKATRDLLRCNQLYQRGAYEDALVGYEELIQQLGDEKILANLGYTLQALHRHEEAIIAFQKYLQTFIARHHAWKALCFSYYHLEDYENMTRCAREAIRWDIRLNTPDDYAWQQMATAHFLMEDYSTALKAARKASALNAKNPFSRYYEACIITALVEGATLDQDDLLEEEPSYQQALHLLEKTLKLSPQLEQELREEGYLDEVFKLFDALPKVNKLTPEVLAISPPAELPTIIKAHVIESPVIQEESTNQEESNTQEES